MVTHSPSVAGNLRIKTLIARQQSTNYITVGSVTLVVYIVIMYIVCLLSVSVVASSVYFVSTSASGSVHVHSQ